MVWLEASPVILTPSLPPEDVLKVVNDDYDEDVRALFPEVGAFDLNDQGKDSAISVSVGEGLFTAHVNDADGGVGLVEVFRIPSAGIELVNLSARAVVSEGSRTLIGGFVLDGETVRTILIRGIGPGLDMDGTLSDPVIYLYKGEELVAWTDDWGGNVFYKDFFEKAGATGLAEDSKDAVLVLPLLPGAYTVHLVGKQGEEGIALLELYDLGD